LENYDLALRVCNDAVASDHSVCNDAVASDHRSIMKLDRRIPVDYEKKQRAVAMTDVTNVLETLSIGDKKTE
jgi:hypothetical protein